MRLSKCKIPLPLPLEKKKNRGRINNTIHIERAEDRLFCSYQNQKDMLQNFQLKRAIQFGTQLPEMRMLTWSVNHLEELRDEDSLHV